MNIKKKSRKNIVLIGILVAAILLGGFVIFAHLNRNTTPVQEAPTTDSDPTIDVPASTGLTPAEEDTKEQYVDSVTEEAPSVPDSSTASSAAINISASQKDNSVVISTQITTIGDGSCTLSVTNGAAKYTDTADVIYQPSYSTCAGFTVPVAELGTGTWTISVSAKGLEGTTIEKSTNLKVA